MLVYGNLKKAIIKSMTGKFAVYIVQLVSLVSLARIFTPEQFGVVGAAAVFVMFFQLMTVSGLAPAIVYRKEFLERERDGVFTFTVFLGFFLCLIFFLIANSLFDWFGFSSGIEVFYFLSGVIFFSSISTVPMASLQKDIKFHSMAVAEILSEVISFGICFYLYFLGFTYIALASKILAVSFFRFVFYYYFSVKTNIGCAFLSLNIGEVGRLFGFSKYQIAFNFLNYFSRNLDQILIAKYFGALTLGSYEKVIQIMRYPLQLFTFTITPALQPILTKHQDEPDVVEAAYYKVIIKLACAGLFVSTVSFWGASEIVYIFFGEQWGMVAPMLGLLSISIPLQMVLSSTGGVFQAFGKTKQQFFCGLFSSVVNVLAIVVGVFSGDVLFVCLLLPLAFLVNYFQAFYILHRNVFSFEKYKKFIVVTVVILVPYLNYVFYFYIDYLSPVDYFFAFLSLCKVFFVTVFSFGMLYVCFSGFIGKVNSKLFC
jgi:O-antigen/teichoic acid export membrane protein